MKALTAAFVFATLIWSSPAYADADDLCLSVMRGDIKDRESRYSEEDTFKRYQNIFKTAHFKSYEEMSGASGNLGIDIPIADALLGLSAGGKTDSRTFQNEVDQFLNSTYDEARAHSKSDVRKEVINAQLLSVVENCHNRYFGSLRDRVGLSTTVDLNDYSSFTISLESTIPAVTEQGLIIQQIEPAALVRCTENGKPVALGISRLSQVALMECIKDSERTVNLRIRTNAGISNVMVLPKPPPPQPIHAAAPPPPPKPPYVWTAAAQQWPSNPVFCTCSKIIPKGFGASFSGYVVVNNCHGSLSVAVVKDEIDRTDTMPPLPAPERLYTLVTLEPGKSIDIEVKGAKYSMAGETNCPDPVQFRRR